MIEITVDFGDRAVSAPKVVQNVAEMVAYLERIPDMIGFQMNRRASVTIKRIPKDPNQQPLFN